MKIAYFSSDWAFQQIPGTQDTIAVYGGTYHYRMALPSQTLDRHTGHEVVWVWTVDARPDGSLRAQDIHFEWHDDIDMFVFQRWMAEDAADWTAKALAAGQVIVNDIDDNFFTAAPTNYGVQNIDPKNNPQFNKDHYRRQIKAASGATVSTDFLRKQMEGYGVHAVVCRNCIDIERWTPNDTNEGHVGWVGGLAWRSRDMEVIRDVIPKHLERHKLSFFHGGHMDDLEGLDPVWVKLGIDLNKTPVGYRPLASIADYPQLWDEIQVSLIPLEVCDFNRAKSWLKQLESSAKGVPYIVSDLYEQRLFVKDGGAGRIARNEADWKRHLEALRDPDVRAAEGKANRAHAETWDINLHWQQWDDAYKEFTR